MNNSGLSMLLKTFGVDMGELMGQVDAARAGTLQMVQHFDARMRAIEHKQDLILAALNKSVGGSSSELPSVVTEVQTWKQTA